MSRMGRVWVPFRRPGVPQWRQGKHFGAHVCRRTRTRAASMPVSFLGRCGNPQGGTGWILWQDQTARGVETCRVEREVSILSITYTHDGVVWTATVGEPLQGTKRVTSRSKGKKVERAVSVS